MKWLKFPSDWFLISHWPKFIRISPNSQITETPRKIFMILVPFLDFTKSPRHTSVACVKKSAKIRWIFDAILSQSTPYGEETLCSVTEKLFHFNKKKNRRQVSELRFDWNFCDLKHWDLNLEVKLRRLHQLGLGFKKILWSSPISIENPIQIWIRIFTHRDKIDLTNLISKDFFEIQSI